MKWVNTLDGRTSGQQGPQIELVELMDGNELIETVNVVEIGSEADWNEWCGNGLGAVRYDGQLYIKIQNESDDWEVMTFEDANLAVA